MDRGDGGVFLDEYRVLELTPVPGLWRVLGGRWARVGLYNDWLEVGHVKISRSHVRSPSIAEDFHLSLFRYLLFSSSVIMLLYEDIITGDEMFSDAFPV